MVGNLVLCEYIREEEEEKTKENEENGRKEELQADTEEEEEVSTPKTSEEDNSKIKQILETQETQEDEEHEANEEGIEEVLEGDFLNYKIPHIIPTGYESDSEESLFSEPCHSRGMLLMRLPKITGVTAVPCVNTPLRREEKIIKVHIENVKYMNENRLDRKLKKREVELTRLLDEEKHLRNEQRELLCKLEQKQALGREMIEQTMQKSGEAAVHDTTIIKNKFKVMEEKPNREGTEMERETRKRARYRMWKNKGCRMRKRGREGILL